MQLLFLALMIVWSRSFLIAAGIMICTVFFACPVDAGVVSFGAFTGEFVTVGDPGNAADSSGYGSVSDEFQIMKYEVTNAQYAEFLNVKAATDTYSLYDTGMSLSGRGGINRNGVNGTYSYTVRANMGDKPVNFVSWFDAARYSNWLHNGATSSASTETGAYDLGGKVRGDAVALISGARYFIPTENQWYKAAYYKGGSTNAGYWSYATQSDSAPTRVSASATGVGSAGNSGNYANFNSGANWNGVLGNSTTVGTNGGQSYYGTFDMSGNVAEWNDFNGSSPYRSRGFRGGSLQDGFRDMNSAYRGFEQPDGKVENWLGFRVASLSSTALVPEPSMFVISSLFGVGVHLAIRRKTL